MPPDGTAAMFEKSPRKVVASGNAGSTVAANHLLFFVGSDGAVVSSVVVKVRVAGAFSVARL
jgi:hypothetical protein